MEHQETSRETPRVTGVAPRPTAHVGRDIYLHRLTRAQSEGIRDALRFPNPEYLQALRMDRKGFGIPHTLEAFDFDPSEPGDLSVPRGAVGIVRKHVPGIVFEDCRRVPERIASPEEVSLRDYQKDAVDSFCSVGQGYVVIPCGGGKTMVAMGVISRLGVRACVLVHTKDLKAQWERNLGKAGLSGIASVCMIQGTPRLPEHDILVLDEAHHVAASTFRDLVGTSDAMYRLGLTATPEREDGLTAFLDLYFGGCVYSVTHAQLVSRGVLVVPKVETVHTGFRPSKATVGRDGKHDYGKIVSELVLDVGRNELIVRVVEGTLSPGDVALVLSNRIGHCEALASLLVEDGVNAVALTSSVPKKRREEILGMASRKEVQVICATSIADEGLDLPVLSKVYLALPSRAAARLTQRLGRLMRPCEGKGEAVLFDFVDSDPLLSAQARKRAATYRKILGACANGT